ncbi:MAG: cyclic nucleotide-binding domain-containing protein, partial [Desulfofustis sp.]|nr:cyclic nucleotide-binding domain-containing protein [Desulfofustis sp.]
ILHNDELVENLASFILNKYITDDQDEAIRILQKLGKSLCWDDVTIRERSLMVISVFTEIILEEDFSEFREVLARLLVDWLKCETEYIAGFEIVCLQLQKIVLRMLYAGQWHELENLIIVLYQISSGVIVKNNLIRGMTAKVHENLAEPDLLDKLVNVYLDENDDRRPLAESLLIHLGRLSATFLVQKLIYCNNKEDRFSLIDLIPKVGEIGIPVLIACLKDEPPWFVIRNIVLIVSRLGDPGLFKIVEPYLTHNDIRVQQQVVNCIETLGGKLMRKRLIQALMHINDELKGQLIVQLGQFEGKDIGNAFLDLLEQRHTIASHVRHDLLLKLCVKLKFYPSQRALDCLKDLIGERRNRFGEADKIVRAAATSFQAIEIKMKGDVPVTEKLEVPLTISEASRAETVPADDELGSLDGGLGGLGALFSDSEIEDMAAGSEIATVTEAKMDTRSAGAGQEMPFYSSQDHHLLVWSKLYEQMSTEEVSDFFALLKPVVYQANDEIVHQGDNVTELFFIDSGFAGITHIDEHSEILLTSLQTGDLIGGEGFVGGLHWSVSLLAQTELQVRILEREAFAALAENHPGLEEKLRYYCNHYDVVPYLINISDSDSQPAIGSDLEVCSASIFLDAAGEPVADTIQGALQYVARGGYCFSLPLIHQDNSANVLGRQVSSDIELPDGSQRRCFGVIAGAGRHDWNDQMIYLYVKFYHPLEKADFACSRIELM